MFAPFIIVKIIMYLTLMRNMSGVDVFKVESRINDKSYDIPMLSRKLFQKMRKVLESVSRYPKKKKIKK